MRLAVHMARMVKERGCIGCRSGNRSEETNRDLGIDGWLLAWIYKQSDVGMWTGLSWSWIGTVGGRL